MPRTIHLRCDLHKYAYFVHIGAKWIPSGLRKPDAPSDSAPPKTALPPTTAPSETPPAEEQALSSGRQKRFSRYDCSAGCPVEAALEVIGGKWKGLALYHLADGPHRFSALKRLCGSVTQRTLTKQLRELEADGLLTRTVYPVVPPKVEYALTAKGEALIPILRALREWGAAHALPSSAPDET